MLNRVVALSYVLLLSVACQPAAETKSAKPVAAKKESNQEAKKPVAPSSDKVPTADVETPLQLPKTEPKPDAEPVPVPTVSRKNGDPYFTTSEIEKITYINAYPYNPTNAAPYRYVDFAKEQIGFLGGDFLYRRKAPLTSAEAAKIRAAIAKVKYYVPAVDDCSDPSKFGPTFRDDYTIEGKSEVLRAYGATNCEAGRKEYGTSTDVYGIHGVLIELTNGAAAASGFETEPKP